MKKSEMLEVTLGEPDDFLVLKETLTRMGQRTGQNELTQACYILHKKGRYFVAHVNELKALDGDDTIMTEDDVMMRNSIAILLDKWGLCEIAEPLGDDVGTIHVTVVPHKDKAKWRLISDYEIGKIKVPRWAPDRS
jgi:translational regulator